ncbi:MAG: Integral membrane protein [uncultured Thermomicrobiales bacterium]|uniref:Integral membrane protein n=1 Tax=uncultured Thermomicrobiales bacterium TaxID=1645740 RepID=A0A6J4UKR2_9BACT|nr:MAG: Integral membrane protein [uncultured Thermomicrobiales bacterium]
MARMGGQVGAVGVGTVPAGDAEPTRGSTRAADPIDEDGGSTLGRLAPRLIGGAVLAVVVLSALTLFADVRQLGDAFRRFDWWLAVPVILLTLGNYALRIVKWEIYLRRIGVPRMPLVTSALVFLSAFSMSITPGKVGEVVKAVYVRRLTGTPVSRTAAVIAAERITDGLAMLALAGVGLTQFAYGRPLLGAATVLALGAVVLLRKPALLTALTARLGGLPLVGRPATKVAQHVEHFLDASNVLYAPGLLVGSIGLGVLSWFGECVALFLILYGLGLEPTWHLLIVATFVLSVSSVFGAVSLLPGGLGVAEASVAGMLLLLLGDDLDRGTAAAATLLIRFATLWFAVILGVVALAVIERRLGAPSGSTAASGRPVTTT